MVLKYNLTSEEHGGLDEGIRELYTEKDGGFVLSVEGIEDTSGLKSALTKERDLAKEYKKQVAAWEALGKKPEEISEILKQLEKQKAEPPKAVYCERTSHEHQDVAFHDRHAVFPPGGQVRACHGGVNGLPLRGFVGACRSS